MGKPQKKPRIKAIFGRIVSDPTRRGGRPMIRNTNIEVREVLKLLRRGLSYPQIRDLHQQLTNEDITACRAWQARFMPYSLTRKFNHAANVNFFMLDENISYLLLYNVVKLFGKSSHVYADDLGGKPDEEIWQYLVDKKYKAILTADKDFVNISIRRRQALLNQYGSIANCPIHVPVVIYMGREHDPKKISAKVEKYRDEIIAYAEANDAAYARISWHEFAKMDYDDDYTPKQKKPANSNRRPKP